MSNIKHIYLIRHARPDFPGGIRLCLGRKLDLPICEEGGRKAQKTAEYIRKCIGKPVSVVYSSPLLRALQTARIIGGKDARIVTDEEIIELDNGEWDGLSFEEISRRYPDLFESRKDDMSICPPGGESYHHGADRMKAALKRLAAADPEENIVVVAHSSINRGFLCCLIGLPYKYNRNLPQEYACVSRIDYDPDNDRWTVKEIGHEETV